MHLTPFYQLKTTIDWEIEFIKIAFPEDAEGFEINQSQGDKQVIVNAFYRKISHRFETRYTRDINNTFVLHLTTPRTIRQGEQSLGKGVLFYYVLEFKTIVSTLFEQVSNLQDPAVLNHWTIHRILKEVLTKVRYKDDSSEKKPLETANKAMEAIILKGESLETAIKSTAAMILYQTEPDEEWSTYDQTDFFKWLEAESSSYRSVPNMNPPSMLEIIEDKTMEGQNHESRITIQPNRFGDEQVFLDNQPFLKPGTAKHNIVLEIAKSKNHCVTSTELAELTNLDNYQIKKHFDRINRDYRKLKGLSKGVLLKTSHGKHMLVGYDWILSALN